MPRAVLLSNATRGVRQLAEVEPFHVAAFVKELEGELSPPTVKQQLSALRMLFDWLVTGFRKETRSKILKSRFW